MVNTSTEVWRKDTEFNVLIYFPRIFCHAKATQVSVYKCTVYTRRVCDSKKASKRRRSLAELELDESTKYIHSTVVYIVFCIGWWYFLVIYNIVKCIHISLSTSLLNHFGTYISKYTHSLFPVLQSYIYTHTEIQSLALVDLPWGWFLSSVNVMLGLRQM